eukprot:TRINITY_DN1682_c1_g1_i8.p1 TRINITY_DN1682_c1_g1~~TRINITY_DN1682_c1_g1_i8.p1  ORF type:complete len:201 (-),score=-19.31 TRINITY_DN1682_c1_g1_i8:338-940(-)
MIVQDSLITIYHISNLLISQYQQSQCISLTTFYKCIRASVDKKAHFAKYYIHNIQIFSHYYRKVSIVSILRLKSCQKAEISFSNLLQNVRKPSVLQKVLARSALNYICKIQRKASKVQVRISQGACCRQISEFTSTIASSNYIININVRDGRKRYTTIIIRRRKTTTRVSWYVNHRKGSLFQISRSVFLLIAPPLKVEME